MDRIDPDGSQAVFHTLDTSRLLVLLVALLSMLQTQLLLNQARVVQYADTQDMQSNL